MFLNEDMNIRQLCNPAGVLTLLRLPLGIAFPFVGGEPLWATIVIGLAALSDVLDGYVARRLGVSSHLGGFADGWIDKIFNINVVWSLVVYDWMSGWMALLLFTREWIQIPMVPYYVTRYMRGKLPPNQPILSGKLCSVFLVVAMLAALWQIPIVFWGSVFMTSLLGIVTIYFYVKREFEESHNQDYLH